MYGCSEGYQIDADGYCSLCEDGYVRIPNDPPICAPQIENCFNHEVFEEEFKCKECSTGYRLGKYGLCDECEENSLKIESERFICLPAIMNCIDYQVEQDTLVCMECKGGYLLDSNNECGECGEGYIRSPNDNVTCIREMLHCLKYEIISNENKCIDAA